MEEARRHFKAKKDLHVIDALHSVVATDWVWPAVRRPFHPQTVLTDLVTEKRFDQSHNALRGDASEILLLYPVLRFFAETSCKNIGMDDKIASLLLLCDMLDCIDLIKKGFGTEASATTLQDIMKKHLTAFKECYGIDSLIPKNHYSMHLPQQWLECLMRWFDCWPHERKHRTIIAKARLAYIQHRGVRENCYFADLA